jgi:acetyltransferase
MSALDSPDAEGARLLIERAGRAAPCADRDGVKALLAAFHIPVTRTMLARSASEAMLIASQLGYPVALKIDSPDISHKSDVRGVALNVMTATQVRDTYNDMLAAVAKVQPQARINGVTIQPMSGKPRGRELYIGMTTDDPFGPVITFGAGGTMIELIADRAMELPPLNQFLAHRLIERARVAETLGSWRGAPPVDVDALEQVLLRVSEMVCALPQLREMDINPIILDESGAVAVDARIVVEPAAPRRACPTSTWPSCPTRPAWRGNGRSRAAGCAPSAPSSPTTPTCCRPWCAACRRKAATSASSARCRRCRRACWRATP